MSRSEFASYYTNKALGMTMQYGLRASMAAIGRLSHEIQKGDHADELGSWDRIQMVDTAEDASWWTAATWSPRKRRTASGRS